MRIGIAGYGTIGKHLSQVVGAGNDVTAYDPPKGLSSIKEISRVEILNFTRKLSPELLSIKLGDRSGTTNSVTKAVPIL